MLQKLKKNGSKYPFVNIDRIKKITIFKLYETFVEEIFVAAVSFVLAFYQPSLAYDESADKCLYLIYARKIVLNFYIFSDLLYVEQTLISFNQIQNYYYRI